MAIFQWLEGWVQFASSPRVTRLPATDYLREEEAGTTDYSASSALPIIALYRRVATRYAGQ